MAENVDDKTRKFRVSSATGGAGKETETFRIEVEKSVAFELALVHLSELEVRICNLFNGLRMPDDLRLNLDEGNLKTNV